MTIVLAVLAFVFGAGIVGTLAYFRLQQKGREEEQIIEKAKKRAEVLVQEALVRADEIRKEAVDEAHDAKNRAREQEAEAKERRAEITRMEQRLAKKEENIDKKSDLQTAKDAELLKREAGFAEKEAQIQAREDRVASVETEVLQRLEQVAGLSPEAAKEELKRGLVEEAKADSAKEVRALLEQGREGAAREAQRIIAIGVARYAGEYSAERLVSVVNLQNDEMKGRIIGREGRNIRAFEAATGVDVIIDDTPEAVILSGFSGVRREIARLSMEKLIGDGRIHPGRIEEVVKKTESEVEASIKVAGEHAAMELGVFGLNPELVKILGRLKYRTSYGQNVLVHSMEVGHLAGLIGAELGLKIKICKRAGLLHDLGKALDHEVEGPHALIGAQYAKKYGETQQIYDAIGGHHDEAPADNIITQIVMAADALSGARPGARREMLESYVKRLEDLEKISISFNGVEKAFAFQAGREVRVLVDAGRVSDDHAVVICNDIAKKIQDELTFPGQIKVTVIREMRTTAFAN